MNNNYFLLLSILIIGCNSYSEHKSNSKNIVYSGPIIDMHLHAAEENELTPDSMAMCIPLSTIVKHFDPKNNFGDVFWGKASNPECDAPLWSPTTYANFIERLNYQFDENQLTAVVSGSLPATEKLINHFPDRLIRGLQFRINKDDLPPDSLRILIKEHDIKVLGEIANQYGGIAPNDERMFPYYELAEELDIPILLHMGSGLPGTPLFLNPEYKVAHSNPVLLEEVLKKFPKMRIAIAHYGEPFIDELIAMMYHYPQIYIDLGGIQWCYPEQYFHENHLKELINAGFDQRIMFGTDMIIWPELIEKSIAIINDANYLSHDQKADIFYNNAVRFLRLESN